MIKKLVAFGDSFTWGCDIKDAGHSPSEFSWASVTAKKLNLEYICLSRGGRSNDSIARNCIEYCNSTDYDRDALIAVMWTYPIRHEVFLKIPYRNESSVSNYFCLSTWHGLSLNERISTFNLAEEDMDYWYKTYQTDSVCGVIDLAKINDDRLAFQHWFIMSLKTQLLTMNYLKSKNIPHVFLYATHDAIKPFSCREDSFIDILIKEISNGSTVYPLNGGLVELTETKRFKVGRTNHPLEEAHEYFAVEHVLPYVTANIPF